MAGPGPGGRLQGLGPGLRRRAARRRRLGRAGHRRRAQRHRDAPVGRPRGRDGPGGPAGAGRRGRSHRDRCRRRRRRRAGEVLLMVPDVVATERLRLPIWTGADVAAIRGGERRPGWHPQFPREDDVDATSMWRDGDPWSSRSITRADVVVGSIGFFGPPQPADDGVAEVEVGYGLVEDARGVGYATEALTAMAAA